MVSNIIEGSSWDGAGVLLCSSAAPNMCTNIIKNNEGYGIKLIDADPVMAYYGNARNLIANNWGCGKVNAQMYLTSNSVPLLDYGHNDIDKNSDGYHIYIDTTSDWDTVYARRNYWGSANSSYFSFYPSNGVVYRPWDTSSNTGELGKVPVLVSKGLSTADYERLFAAMDLEYQGRYREAADAYRQIIAEYGAKVISRRALSGLVMATYLSGGDLRAFHSELQKIAQSFTDTGFGRKALFLALDCLELAGDYEGAIVGYRKLQSEGGEAGAMAALRAGEIVLYGIGDKARAEKVFQEVVSSFPQSEAAELARMHLVELPDLPESLGRPAPQRLQPEAAEGGKSETKVVIQNYPNPANPTTRITFTLPERAQVTLEIYNLLGQRVRTWWRG